MICTEDEARAKKCKMAGAGRCEASDCMHWAWYDWVWPGSTDGMYSPTWVKGTERPVKRGWCGMATMDTQLGEIVEVDQ